MVVIPEYMNCKCVQNQFKNARLQINSAMPFASRRSYSCLLFWLHAETSCKSMFRSQGSIGSSFTIFLGLLYVRQIMRISVDIFSALANGYCKDTRTGSSVTILNTIIGLIVNPRYNVRIITIKIMFVSLSSDNKCIADKLSDIEAELGYQGNQYLFLRSIWRTHSHLYNNTVVDLDDQMDRLNKIVAMMRKHINFSAKKQLYYQNSTSYDDISLREARVLQAMGKASLEAQQFRSRLAKSMNQNQQLKKMNSELRQQIHQLKKKRKEDTRTINQLVQKNACLQSKILASDFHQSKSSTSFLRTSRKADRSCNQEPLRQSLLNISICENIPKTKGSVAGRQKSAFKSNNRYSHAEADENWLQQTSIIANDLLDQSVLSISSYGFLSDNPSLLRIASQQENKENLTDFKHSFHYESERNLLKQKSLKKNRLSSIARVDVIGESPKQAIKFVRQNSKKTLLTKSRKVNQSTLIQ